MKKKLELSKSDSDYLSEMPEQGMGYQIVMVTLKNGQVLNQRIIVNSTYLLLDENEQFRTEDIESIIIQEKFNNK